MIDQAKTKKQLLQENEELRRRLSDLERAETALQESEKCFRKIFEEGPIGIALVGLDARIQRCNPRFCAMLGYSEAEIIALGIAGITHPEDFEREQRLGGSLLRGAIPSYTIEKRYLGKNRQPIWTQLAVSMMHDAQGKPAAVIGMIEDITERKQTEQKLQQSEAKYRRLHESMRDAFASTDMEGGVQECNDAFREMLGYEPEELLQLRYTDITPPRWHRFEAEIIENQILARSYSETYEKEYRRKDGTIFPVELRTFLLRDEAGHPSSMWAIVRDITERKQAEEALQRAREELEQRVEERTAELTAANEQLAVFRRFADAAGQGFGMADLDGYVTYLNPAMCRILEIWGPEDAIGKHVSTYYSEPFLPLAQAEELLLAHPEGYWSSERMVVSHSGRLVPTIHANFLVRDTQGRPSHLAVVVTDITERKRAEEQLHQSSERFVKAFNSNPSPMAISSSENRTLEVNQAFWRTLGYESAEVIGEVVSELDLFVEPEQQKAAQQVLLQEGALRDFPMDVRTKDGQIRHGLF